MRPTPQEARNTRSLLTVQNRYGIKPGMIINPVVAEMLYYVVEDMKAKGKVVLPYAGYLADPSSETAVSLVLGLA